jgi:hypothetical protein
VLSSLASPPDSVTENQVDRSNDAAALLVSVLFETLLRYEDGEIDEKAVAITVRLVASLLKGVELTAIEQQGERIRELLDASGLGGVRLGQTSHA